MNDAEKTVNLLQKFLKISDNIRIRTFGTTNMTEKTEQLQKNSAIRHTSIENFFFRNK